MKNYGIRANSLKWYESYHNNQKQFISFNSKHTSFVDINCGVAQGSILGLVSFLIYVNDLNQASDVLDPIMFTDNTNLFYSYEDVKTLFHTVNTELVKVKQCFKANKVLSNIKKANYALFHKPSTKYDIPLKIPELVISNKLIEQKRFIKFSGVILDECISWRDHIRTVENEIAKCYSILVLLKVFIFHIFIHILTTQTLPGASTQKTKLRKINIKQKHTVRMIFNEFRLCHSRPLFKTLST